MLQTKLDRLIRIGRLSVIWPNGALAHFGDLTTADLDVVVRVRTYIAAAKIAARPHFYLGEAYASGDLTIERGSLGDLLALLGRNLALRPMRSPGFVRRLEQSALAGLLQRNSQRSARRNVARHYDFS